MKVTRQYSFSNLPELHGLCPPQLTFFSTLNINIKYLKKLPCVCKLYKAHLMLYRLVRLVRHYNDTNIAWLERMCVIVSSIKSNYLGKTQEISEPFKASIKYSF